MKHCINLELKPFLSLKNLVQYFETLCLIFTRAFVLLICNIAELVPAKPF